MIRWPIQQTLVCHHLPFRPAQTLLGRNDPKFVLPHLRNWGQRAVQHFFIPVHAFMVRWQRHLFYIHEFRPMKILSALDLFHDLPDALSLSTMQHDVLRHLVDNKRLANAHARWSSFFMSSVSNFVLTTVHHYVLHDAGPARFL